MWNTTASSLYGALSTTVSRALGLVVPMPTLPVHPELLAAEAHGVVAVATETILDLLGHLQLGYGVPEFPYQAGELAAHGSTKSSDGTHLSGSRNEYQITAVDSPNWRLPCRHKLSRFPETNWLPSSPPRSLADQTVVDRQKHRSSVRQRLRWRFIRKHMLL